MTNEEKAQRLEQMAKWADRNALRWKDRAVNCGSHPRESEGCMALSEAESADAALLRECAAMMRERGWQPADTAPKGSIPWDCGYRGSSEPFLGRLKNGDIRKIYRLPENYSHTWADEDQTFYAEGWLTHWMPLPQEPAAQAAAVAWVDEQEGRP